MTNTEAISILNGYNLRSNAGVKGLSALDIGIEAIEKQIPQKPLDEPKYYGNGKCPCCNVVFIDKSTNYCGNCGQALDWGEDKCTTT